MRAGQLRHRIAIQEKAIVRDTFGAEVETWVTQATVWAMVETPSGTEFNDAERTAATITHKVTIRQRDRVWPTMRLLWGVHTLTIEAVLPDNLNRQIILLCSEVPPQSGGWTVGVSPVGGVDEVG